MNTETGPSSVVTNATLIDLSSKLKTALQAHRAQVVNMASFAGIALEEPKVGSLDPRIALYEFLRSDKSKDTEKYKGITDQNLFAEVLRILGDTEQLTKFKAAYPNIFPAV